MASCAVERETPETQLDLSPPDQNVQLQSPLRVRPEDATEAAQETQSKAKAQSTSPQPQHRLSPLSPWVFS